MAACVAGCRACFPPSRSAVLAAQAQLPQSHAAGPHLPPVAHSCSCQRVAGALPRCQCKSAGSRSQPFQSRSARCGHGLRSFTEPVVSVLPTRSAARRSPRAQVSHKHILTVDSAGALHQAFAAAINGSASQAHASPYTLVKSAGLGQMKLMVFARRQLLSAVSNVSSSWIATGVAGVGANKGVLLRACRGLRRCTYCALRTTHIALARRFLPLVHQIWTYLLVAVRRRGGHCNEHFWQQILFLVFSLGSAPAQDDRSYPHVPGANS